MNIGYKILFASTLVLSAVTSAYAAEEDALMERETYMATSVQHQHIAGNRVRAHHATEARAYAPASVSADETVDFGIGSQR